MIVQPPDRRRKTPTLGENREIALGVVVMSIATALLLTYFLGFYCDAREGWPCLATPAQMAGESEAQPPPEAPGGSGPGLAPAALTPLNPALMVPSAPSRPTEPFVPPTVAQPTRTIETPKPPTPTVRAATASATPLAPSGSQTIPPLASRTGTATLGGPVGTGSPIAATSYPAPATPAATAPPQGYPSPSSSP